MSLYSLDEQANIEQHDADNNVYFVAQCGINEWCIAINDDDAETGCSRASEEIFTRASDAETAHAEGAWTPA